MDSQEVREGQQFGRLIVMTVGVVVNGRRGARCRCSCGTERNVTVSNLLDGRTRSCGCLRAEIVSAAKRVHGTGYEDYRYRTWRTIIGKCYRESHQDYRYYGGRGIKMAEEWRADFPAFAAYLDSALGPRPDGYTLDRVDNDGDYEPGNLRWATRSQQALNRRRRRRE
jgi:hypothetical protein